MSRKKKNTKLSPIVSVDEFKISESYTSLLLGLLVVLLVLAGSFLFFNVKGRIPVKQITSQKQDVKSDTSTQNKNTKESPSGKIIIDSYTVQDGDLLWDIAVRAYGDGYRWPEIQQANNLTDPDVLIAGTVLKIPR